MLDCVMLDIGGTFVKYGAVWNGTFTQPGMFPIDENASSEQIIHRLAEHLKENPSKKIAVSMPGTADYRNGTLLMKHKFAAMYGVSLKEVLHQRLAQSEIVFVHDGAAFMLGEALFGAARGFSNAAGVMLGTGLGFVLYQQGKVQLRPGLTPLMPLWNKPYRPGISEDYVSGRGICRRWAEQGHAPASVKEIADMARNGSEDATALLRETGGMLGEMLQDHLAGQAVERIVIGGQIAKSWDLLKDGFESSCSIAACSAENLADAALRGGYAYVQKGDSLLRIHQDA